jgi:hypothetical protein
MEPNRNLDKRTNDFPELQVGYPERNDVRNPNDEMERIHVNLDNFELSRKRAGEVTLELRDQNTVK